MSGPTEEICYARNFLKEAVAAVQFASPPISLTGQVLPVTLQKAIKESYKIYEPNVATERTFKVSPAGGVENSESTEFQNWTFHGEAREKTIRLNKNLLHVSNLKYKSYSKFKSDFVRPLQELIDLEPQIAVARTGVRFINMFSDLDVGFDKLEEYFHPMVAASFSNLLDAHHCSRQIQISEYSNDDWKLRIQSGIFNSNYPAAIRKIEFLLDFDCYVDTPHLISEVPALVDTLHDNIQNNFERLITENLREYLNEQSDSSN